MNNELDGPASAPPGGGIWPLSVPGAQTAHTLARIARYAEYRAFYNGDQWEDLPAPGERRLTFNYARVFVNKAASYLLGKPVGYDARSAEFRSRSSDRGASIQPSAVSRQPSAEILRCTQNDSGGGIHTPHSALRTPHSVESFLDEVADFNMLAALDLDTAISTGCLGDGAWTVRWDAAARLPRVTGLDPVGLDARWRADDLRSLLWVRQSYWLSPAEMTARQLDALRAGGGSGAGTDPYTAMRAHEEWTAEAWQLTVNGVPVDGGPNPYGQIPYVIFPNLRVPGEFWGESDLVDLLRLQRELNARLSIFSRILEVAGNPVAVISGADAASTDTLRLGPNQLWTLPEGAKAEVLDLLRAGGAEAHLKYIDTVYRAMHDISEMPRTSFGDSSHGTMARSGVALEIELQPLLHKLARKRAIWSSALARRAQLILAVARLHSDGAANLPDVRLSVTWPPVLPQDRTELVQQETALVAAGIHPPTAAIAALNDPDPDAVFGRVLAERAELSAVSRQPSATSGQQGEPHGTEPT
ncbi:MAG: phage portal protein [Chloroflexia bacterium]